MEVVCQNRTKLVLNCAESLVKVAFDGSSYAVVEGRVDIIWWHLFP